MTMLSAFRWVIAGELAGSARPGLLGPFEEDIAFLKEVGIRTVVTLTEGPLEPDVAQFGLKGIHFPIDDMGIPTPRASESLCRNVLASLARKEPVLLHCKAGLGRTGTMLACCLVTMGRPPDEAVAELRRVHTSYIQTEAQVRFIQHYADHLTQASSEAPKP